MLVGMCEDALLRGHPCSMLVCAQPIEGGFGRPWTMIMYTRHKEVLVDSCETKQTCQWISLLSMLSSWLVGRKFTAKFPTRMVFALVQTLEKISQLVIIPPCVHLLWKPKTIFNMTQRIVDTNLWNNRFLGTPKKFRVFELAGHIKFSFNTWLAVYMGVSKNRGYPKWMVYNGNPIQMDDLGVPPFTETPIWCLYHSSSARVYLFSPSNRCSVSQGGSDSFWELHRKLGERSFVCNALRCISGSMYHMGTHSFIFGVFQPRTRWIKKQTLSVFQLESLINIILKKPIGVT